MDYQVKKGDTLNEIARLFNFDPAILADINQLADPNKIQAGANMNVPQYPPMEETMQPSVFNPEVGMKPVEEFLRPGATPFYLGAPPSEAFGPPYAWGGGGYGTISGEPPITPMDAPPAPQRNPGRVPPPAPGPSMMDSIANADIWNQMRDALNSVLPPEQVDEAVMMAMQLVPGLKGLRLPRMPGGPFTSVPSAAPQPPTPAPTGPQPFNFARQHRVSRNKRVNREDEYLQGEALERRRKHYENNQVDHIGGQLRRKGELDEGTGPMVGAPQKWRY